MAEETIYLCNFRVSVDGDWLCLKELTDVNLDVRLTQIDDGQYPWRHSLRIHLFLCPAIGAATTVTSYMECLCVFVSSHYIYLLLLP